MTWDVLYPRRSGLWPGRSGDQPIKYEPTTKHVVQVDPRNDPDLPQLGGWLESAGLVAYRPGVRATVRVETAAGELYVKVAGQSRMKRLANAEDRLAVALAASQAAQLALPISRYRGASVYATVAGHDLHSLLRNDASEKALVQCGRGIAALHRFGPLSGLPEDPPYTIEQWAEWVEQHDPSAPGELVDEARRVGRHFEFDTLEPKAVLHGDLHDKNVFVAGRAITLIDAGSARTGRPSDDIGMLAAHVVLRSIQYRNDPETGLRHAGVLVDAYLAAGGTALAANISAVTTYTLARLACLYRFRKKWHGVTEQLMALATERVA